ncbi:MAG: 50S ribosomal protein L34 [Candidatus Brocadiae bacterium]|nr:50S ribosomal protein L34 [Candidatus Brocadiia bacterium]
MKVNVRRSSAKYSKMTGFRTRMKTKGGRKVLKRQRNRRRNMKMK